METNEFVEWENRFIAATRRFPPGRDIPAVLEADEVRATSLELWRWIAGQLHAIVDKLPVTKDGVPVVPEMRMWRAGNCGVSLSTATMLHFTASRGEPVFGFEGCYSTQAAAQAAEGEG